ncbi:hypothetical protein [Burkholderia pseudomallei]|uniref:hypothetical protein n=1 Tax=Burkholderia pseudomallei TaxID=28450 RepID=UPI0009763710|nr:hypothetical protein [Burkholderia pseudomallei]
MDLEMDGLRKRGGGVNFTNVAAAKGGRRSHVVHSADARPTPRTHKKRFIAENRGALENDCVI